MTAREPEVFLAVASRFENIELVQAVVDDLLRRMGLEEEDRHWLGLAIREAVANAIKHGNAADPSKQVEVELRLEDGEVVVAVRDQGGGFDPGTVRNPLAPENLLRPGGRGIFYMRSLMDRVEYRFAGERGAAGEESSPEERWGTEVVLRKKIKQGVANPPEEESRR